MEFYQIPLVALSERGDELYSRSILNRHGGKRGRQRKDVSIVAAASSRRSCRISLAKAFFLLLFLSHACVSHSTSTTEFINGRIQTARTNRKGNRKQENYGAVTRITLPITDVFGTSSLDSAAEYAAIEAKSINERNCASKCMQRAQLRMRDRRRRRVNVDYSERDSYCRSSGGGACILNFIIAKQGRVY